MLMLVLEMVSGGERSVRWGDLGLDWMGDWLVIEGLGLAEMEMQSRRDVW